MWRRLLLAIGVVGLFFVIATQTPLERWVFQYQAAPTLNSETSVGVNQFQVVSEEQVEKIKEIEEVQKKVAEKKHENKSKPIKLELPSIYVSAPIYGVGLAPNGAMDTIDNARDIAWYQYSSIPGQEGNALLAGHRDWGKQLGTLFYMETMDIGEELIITYEDGHKETFQLVSNEIYLASEVPEHVMELDGESRITIITCGGKFNRKTGHYDSRVVAVFQKIDD